MVKNTTGGSKAKLQGRKFVNVKATNILRISEDPCEIYAQVTKTLGNGMCHVICLDEKTRLCHIRGKFRVRGKRDNFLGRGTWLLIGLREWESSSESKTDKLQNCDLLEVYSDLDVERLKKSVHENWTIFTTTIDSNTKQIADDESGFEFKNTSNSEEYERIMQSLEKGVTSSIGFSATSKEEEVNIDDI